MTKHEELEQQFELLSTLAKTLIGPEVVPVVRRLFRRTNVSEFKVAEELKTNANQIRNLLYKLQLHNLVSFIRKKDKKKGWYVYYWTLNLKQAQELIVKLETDKLQGLQRQLEKESTSSFFICPDGCNRLTFETAMEHSFKCPECGKVMIQENNAQRISTIKRDIGSLQQEISAGIKLIVEPKKIERIKKVKKKQEKKIVKKVSKGGGKKIKPRIKRTKKKK